MSHTPGPWTADRSANNVIAIGHGEIEVCEIIADEEGDKADELTEADWANARLIAAAPALLDALKTLDRWGRGGLGPDTSLVLCLPALHAWIRALIAEAECAETSVQRETHDSSDPQER